MKLFNEVYVDDDMACYTDTGVLNTNLSLMDQREWNLYQKRVDDMGFAFSSGNAKEKFSALEKRVVQNTDEFCKQLAEKYSKQKATPAARADLERTVQMPTQVKKQEEEEVDL